MTALDPDDRLDASATAALASALGSRTRPELVAALAGPATAPLDAVRPPVLVRPARRRAATVATIAGVALAGALLGGAVAVVVDPAAVEQALPGGQPVAEQAGAAPSSTPSAAAPAAEDRDGRGRGSGHGSGHGSRDPDD